MAFLSPLYFVPLVVWGLTGYVAYALSIAWMGPGTRTRWYESLKKPPFYPPAWVFGVAWTILFTLMGLGAFFAWQENTAIVGGILVEAPGNTNGSLYYGALGLYLAHLLPLASWTGLFFRWKQPGPALALILVVWSASVAVLVLFWLIRPLAGYVFMAYPTFLIVGVASNAWIYWENDLKCQLAQAMESQGSEGGTIRNWMDVMQAAGQQV